jgi:hypothetical protein
MLVTVFVLGLVPLGSCTKRTTKKEYVARVGDALLTKEELVDVGADTAEHMRRRYISQWVDAQLLYQEARRGGFAESDEVRRRVEETKRQLAVNAFLEKEVYSNGDDIADNAALDEFNRNRGAYRLRDDVVNLSYVIFDDRDAANTFRSKIVRGATWDEALQSIQADDEMKSQMLRSASKGYFTQPMLFPEELWKMARTLSKEDVSYVVRTRAGYVVALVHGVRRQGEMPDFDYAKQEIKERLLMESRRRKYEELLATLRGKYEIDVRLHAADSTAGAQQKEE